MLAFAKQPIKQEPPPAPVVKQEEFPIKEEIKEDEDEEQGVGEVPQSTVFGFLHEEEEEEQCEEEEGQQWEEGLEELEYPPSLDNEEGNGEEKGVGAGQELEFPEEFYEGDEEGEVGEEEWRAAWPTEEKDFNLALEADIAAVGAELETEMDPELQELLHIGADSFGHFEPPLPEGPTAKKARLLEEKKAQAFETPLHQDTLSSIKAACELHLDHNSKEVLLAKKFSQFCTTNKQQLLKLGGFGKLVGTKYGQMFLTDKAATAFLMAMQHQAPVQANTLHTKFSTLKKGIRSTDLPAAHMPAWASDGAAPPPVLARYLKHLAKAQASSKPAAAEQGFLTSDHIRQYATNLIIEYKVAKEVQIEPYVDALFMRVQSGRSIRAVDLFAIRMSDVGFQSASHTGGTVPCLEVTIKKPLAKMSVSSAVAANPKSTILLSDILTQKLFDIWWEYTPQEHHGSPDHFFFPAKGPDGFLWDTALTYKDCSPFIQHAALSLGLVSTDDHLATFQLKSIRQGAAAESVAIIKDALAGSNRKRGRAPTSKMDVEVYAPSNALLAPGPLFAPELEDQLYKSTLEEHFSHCKGELLCTVCGYPQCGCDKCHHKAKNAKKMPKGILHSCWMGEHDRGQVGRRSSKVCAETEEEFALRLVDPALQGPSSCACVCWKEQQSTVFSLVLLPRFARFFPVRLAAWEEFCISDVPVFAAGKFQFMG